MTETIQADWYDYTEEQVAALVAQVQKQNKQDGKYESLQYYAQDFQKGTIISFMDCSKDQKFLAAAAVHQYCSLSVDGEHCLWIDHDADKTGDAADADFI